MKRRTSSSNQAGTAMLEFAIIAPMLILLVIGLIEMGRYLNYAVLVGDASRAGVQYGSQTLETAIDFTGMQTAAKNDGQNTTGMTAIATNSCQCADLSPCDPTHNPPDCQNAGNHRILWVTVTTTGNFTSMFHYPGLPNTFTVVQAATRQVAPGSE
jgi:Flp pilus assembly protein TadG